MAEEALVEATAVAIEAADEVMHLINYVPRAPW